MTLVMGKKSDLNEREALAADIARVEGRLNAGIVGQRTNTGDDFFGDSSLGSRAFGIASAFTNENGAKFLHVKLPLRPDTHDEMFYLDFKGYAFGLMEVIDCKVVGYCYKNGGGVISYTDIVGSHQPTDVLGNPIPYLYISSDGFVTCRLKFSEAYYTTVILDVMKVGNGRLLAASEVSMFFSEQESI